MSQPTSGLFPALIDYYRRLEADPDQLVADFGFSAEKVHFRVVLERDGTLAGFDDIRERNEKGKPIPTTRIVPDGGGRSGVGLKPFFCWDNTGYALGRDNKGNPARAAEMFAAFRDLHLEFREELAGDDGFAALCRFLETWDPARAEELPNWEAAAGLNVVFKLRGREGHVHESVPVRNAWSRRASGAGEAAEDEARVTGPSLISGEVEPLARLHPQLKGVVGANTTGAAIVSFNLNAFESYGKSQSYNAPVGTRDAFRYTTALNRLLADGSRRTRIGDATVVFWSDRPEGDKAGEVLSQFLRDDFPREEPAEDAPTSTRVGRFLDDLRQGLLQDRLEDPDAPFYILGLSPNASRLNVRYWMAGTVRQFVERLAKYLEELDVGEKQANDPPLTIPRLLRETAREPKEVSPRLAGDLTRSILQETPYPRPLFDAVLRRVRIEGDVNRVKAAILKAYLIRNYGDDHMSTDVNKQHPDLAYHCGRMFALLDFAQQQALESVNAGVVRRNMGAAMATPGLILGRLLRLAEVGHIPKLGDRIQEFYQDEMQEICGALGDCWPRQLDPVRQGLFALGFYQERGRLDEVKFAIRDKRLHRTERGEWMRSQLEVRVAEIMTRCGISYIYEPRAVLKSGRERRPDFLIEGDEPSQHIYLEVLGFAEPEYDKRWEVKKRSYLDIHICEDGGEAGRLVILDWRSHWREQERRFDSYPSDEFVLGLLRPHLSPQS